MYPIPFGGQCKRQLASGAWTRRVFDAAKELSENLSVGIFPIPLNLWG